MHMSTEQSTVSNPSTVVAGGTIAERVRHFLLNRTKSIDTSSSARRPHSCSRTFSSHHNLAGAVDASLRSASPRLPYAARPRPLTSLRGTHGGVQIGSLNSLNSGICLPPIRGERFVERTNQAYVHDAPQ